MLSLLIILGAVCGEGRVPYACPNHMKCAVVSLPSGLSFKQPAKYTAPELRQIHTSKDNVQFLPLSPPDCGVNSTVEHEDAYLQHLVHTSYVAFSYV